MTKSFFKSIFKRPSSIKNYAYNKQNDVEQLDISNPNSINHHIKKSIEKDDQATTSYLIKESGVGVNHVVDNNRSLLHLSAHANATAVTKYLLENGGKVESVDKFRNTPLHIAADQKSAIIADLLIKHGANIFAINVFRGTPLDISMKHNPPAALKMMEANKDLSKESCLHMAALDNCTDMVKLLLQEGADWHKGNDFGITPLDNAIQVKSKASSHIIAFHVLEKEPEALLPYLEKYPDFATELLFSCCANRNSDNSKNLDFLLNNFSKRILHSDYTVELEKLDDVTTKVPFVTKDTMEANERYAMVEYLLSQNASTNHTDQISRAQFFEVDHEKEKMEISGLESIVTDIKI